MAQELASVKFHPLITAAAEKTGLDWWLIYGVIEQESGFDPAAESACGALGLMQLMPASFPSQTRFSLLDPETNVTLGSDFLRYLISMWREESPDEAIKFGLASYNGGSGYVLAAQELAVAAGLRGHEWSEVAPRLAYCEYAGKRPDAAQMTGYVEAIWNKFERRRGQPAPAAGAEAAV